MATARDATHLGRRVVKWGVASALAGVAFAVVAAFAGVALAASSFSDVGGDNNEAPDVTSVAVSESSGTVTVSVSVHNYDALPGDSWINLWFDLDSNAETGDGGDEVLARYVSDGTLEFYRWNGDALTQQPTDGLTAAYADGVLTFTAVASTLGATGPFGILAVASREQEVVGAARIAADLAPDTGRSAYVGPGPAAFADPEGDQPTAPDVTAVRVTDGKDGTISFSVTTSNVPLLPPQMVVLLLIDSDGKASSGLDGADILAIYQAGEVELGRWSAAQQEFLADDAPSRIQARNASGVVTFLLHRSELGDPSRFRFAVWAAHLGGDGDFDALDIAPEVLFWQYTMAHKAALRLVAGKATPTPARPVAGRSFSVSVPVTRSDTSKRITTGSVTCAVRVGGQKVSASGRIASGRARCSFQVPATASGKRVAGSIVVRSGGKSVSTRFAYTVR